MTDWRPPIFMTPGAVDGASLLEGSDTAASMGWGQALLMQPTDRARSTALSPAFAEWDLGQSFNLDFAAVLFTNASNSATWRVRTATNKADLLASPSYDSGTLDVWMEKASVDYSGWNRVHSWHEFSSVSQRQFVRIDINDPSNADGHVEVGRFYWGKKFQPTRGLTYGSGMPIHAEDVVRLQSEGGLRHPVSRPRPRRARGTLEFEDESEFIANFWEMSRLRGVSQDLLYIPFPDSTYRHHGAIYGVLGAPMTASVPEYGIWQVDFSVEELL